MKICVNVGLVGKKGLEFAADVCSHRLHGRGIGSFFMFSANDSFKLACVNYLLGGLLYLTVFYHIVFMLLTVIVHLQTF